MSEESESQTGQGLPECTDCNRLIQVPSDHETFCPSKGDLIQ